MHQYLIKRSKTVLENENTDLRLSHGKARLCQSERNIEPVRQPVQQRSSHYHKSGGHINISPGFESSIHKSFPVESGTPYTLCLVHFFLIYVVHSLVLLFSSCCFPIGPKPRHRCSPER